MSSLNAYLTFNGNCEEAFTFYGQIFGTKILFSVPYGQAPAGGQIPPGFEKKLMHTRIQVGSTLLMGSDAPPERFQKPQGMSVNVNCDTPAEADRVFSALSSGGQTIMPIQETFWAHRFGMAIDKFGISWLVNCEKPR